MSDLAHKEALYRAIQKYEVRFPESLSSHRRNLLFFAGVTLFSLVISPRDGVYVVNLGVLSGQLKNPLYVYVSLACLCSYQLVYFFTICSSSVVSSLNLKSVADRFFGELSCIRAFNRWCELTDALSAAGRNTAIQGFGPAHRQAKPVGAYRVSSKTEEAHFSQLQGLRSKLEACQDFELWNERGFVNIDFTYLPTTEDYQYLVIYKDIFWLLQRRSFIEFIFPLLLAYAAILGMMYRISQNIF